MTCCEVLEQKHISVRLIFHDFFEDCILIPVDKSVWNQFKELYVSILLP